MLTATVALFLATGLLPIQSTEELGKWTSEVSYLYTSKQHPSETQSWIWHESFELKDTGELVLSSKLTKNLIDNQDLFVPSDLEPEISKILKPFETPVREPALDDPPTFRLWRLARIPKPGTAIRWPEDPRWPVAAARCVATGVDEGKGTPVKFTFTEEEGIQAKGTGFCASDGTLRSGELIAENAFLPGGDGSIHQLKITWSPVKK